MCSKILHIDEYINNPLCGIPSYINNPKQLKIAHSHDYFEIFLVEKGQAIHYINGFTHALSSAMLVFIRPEDVHYYDNMSTDFQIINMVIPVEIIKELFSYLSSGFDGERLLTSSFPPTAQICQNHYSSLLTELEQLAVINEIMKNKVESLFRITIMNIITRCFPMPYTKRESHMPEWFKLLHLEMLKKENVIEGLPKMHMLSGKSKEHLTRVCRKQLNKTPTQFINEIRMAHSVQMLISTNKKVVDICYEVGFTNLSNYYNLFKKLYGMSPQQLRKNKSNQTVLNQIYANLPRYSSITPGLPIE